MKKVVVGMSGGVDSSVAAYLLKEQGYDVIGVTMQIWQEEDVCTVEENGGCCGLSAVEDARRVAAALGIPYYVMNFREEFQKNVIDYFADSYVNGQTPNPCIACNRYVKWEALLKRSISIGADFIATGHYARVEQLSNGRYALRRSATAAKDQTYALYNLTQEQLKRTLMPVGEYTKEEVRVIAEKIGLLVADKPDSQDICFVQDGNYAAFIEEHTGKKASEGNFVTSDGTVIGRHKGIIHYTVGQRKGLGLALGYPAFVLEIRPETNEVVIGTYEESLTTVVRAKQLNFMSVEDLKEPLRVFAKIRYNHKGAWCTVERTKEDEVTCCFEEPQRAVTPGQAISLKANYKIVENMIEEGMVASACSVGYGGIAEALFKMGLGNRIGFKMRADMTTHQMFEPMYGSIILEMVSDSPAGMLLGETTKEYTFESCGEKLDMAELQEIWESKLEPVYPYRKAGPAVEKINGSLTAPAAPKIGVAKPKVIIPVFPGTNCEYDTAKAFARAGADPEILVVRNLTPADVAESCKALVKAIDASQIVMLPGGFSGGDEPDGSAKFIASFFRNPEVTEAVRRLLQQRDGLMLGICNGFQALIKLGLVPYGDIRPITAYDPTLTFNTIGRHQSMLVRTRIASTGSPWLSKCAVGDEHTVAISHGEGRFVAPQEVLDTLIKNGQVATQYVDLTGTPTMDQRCNPNGSVLAIEGITSPDGRVFGKMGHSERSGEYLYKNVTGDKYQPIFEGGVDYFKV